MAMASAILAYPERFHAAATYAGFGKGSHNSGKTPAISRFRNDVVLLLSGLYQQATLGPCTLPKPKGDPVESNKWTSWNGLGNMAQPEAMRLFVKILEEEEPSWYSKVQDLVIDPVVDVEMNAPTEQVQPNTKSLAEQNVIPGEDGPLETQDKDVISEESGSVVYDKWVPLSISGQCPKARYEHGAAIVQDKMYIFGGNHNGRYLNDFQFLDLKTMTWFNVEPQLTTESQESQPQPLLAPCAGHSLIAWGNKLLSVAGHAKDLPKTVTVKEFDLQTSTWSFLKTYGKPPISRGGQSVTLVGSTLVLFGGEDNKRTLLNDLHILDLETMTWDDMGAEGTPPSPRSDHIAAVHEDRYLLIFGGGSDATCFNDLHVLDLQNMEWSRPEVQGIIPARRAGHAGATIDGNWFVVGGGDNESGAMETLVLNMSTFTWSVVTTVEGCVPLASEGLSLVVSSYTGEKSLISFGGYNGRYSNEVHVLKPSHKSTLRLKVESETDNVALLSPKSHDTRDMDPRTTQGGNIREIRMDSSEVTASPNADSGEKGERLLATLRGEKANIDSALAREMASTLELKQDIADAEARNKELTQELTSARSLLASEQARSFKLEVDIAELRQQLQSMEAFEKELELLRRQKVALEQAALDAKQSQNSGGLWGWLAGTPDEKPTA